MDTIQPESEVKVPEVESKEDYSVLIGLVIAVMLVAAIVWGVSMRSKADDAPPVNNGDSAWHLTNLPCTNTEKFMISWYVDTPKFQGMGVCTASGLQGYWTK